MQRDTARRAETHAKHEKDAREQLPTWRNTRPRGNPEPDRHDVERSRERMEAVLGR